MADIALIIKIPEEEYNHIKRTNEYSIAHTGYIYDGIPLDEIRNEIERATIEMDYDTAKEALAVIDKYKDEQNE